MVKVSIIVPVYNVCDYIIECLESLPNQTFKDIEIILVDDGSPDGSGKICDEYEKKIAVLKLYIKKTEVKAQQGTEGLIFRAVSMYYSWTVMIISEIILLRFCSKMRKSLAWI